MSSLTFRMKRFEGKTILVTGGTSGIGLATAKRLTEEGATLLITGYSDDHINTTQAALPKATVIKNDAGDPDAVGELADAAKQLGGLDGAFLNAGLGNFLPLDKLDADELDKLFRINTRGPILQAKALDAYMNGGGSFLFISSGTVTGTGEPILAYASAKAALEQAAKSLATHFAPRQIRVNLVTPGLTETAFHDRMDMTADEQKKYKQSMAEKIPLKRLGQPEDVAAVACFLLSSEAAYVTGANYAVTGGIVMR